jgi:hypothetical protein
MFSFDFRKTSAWDYQRRLLRPWPTSPLRSVWAAITVLLGHRSIRCGPRLRHVGHDYGETKNATHIRTESRPTSHRNQWPTSNGITGPHRPEYAVIARRDFETAAAFDHGEDSGHSRSSLLAPDVDPVVSTIEIMCSRPSSVQSLPTTLHTLLTLKNTGADHVHDRRRSNTSGHYPQAGRYQPGCHAQSLKERCSSAKAGLEMSFAGCEIIGETGCRERAAYS